MACANGRCGANPQSRPSCNTCSQLEGRFDCDCDSKFCVCKDGQCSCCGDNCECPAAEEKAGGFRSPFPRRRPGIERPATRPVGSYEKPTIGRQAPRIPVGQGLRDRLIPVEPVLGRPGYYETCPYAEAAAASQMNYEMEHGNILRASKTDIGNVMARGGSQFDPRAANLVPAEKFIKEKASLTTDYGNAQFLKKWMDAHNEQ